MKLSSLLAQRLTLVRRARLANLASAYQTLDDFVRRTARARITGRVQLQQVAPDDERYCAMLTALDSNQSVIEEHFTDRDVMELADVIAFISGNVAVDFTFRIEDVAEKLLAPIRAELEREGVVFDAAAESIEQPREN